MNDYDNITDVPVSEKFLSQLQKDGASRALVKVVQLAPEDLPEGVDRNSARLELQKYVYWNGAIEDGVFSSKKHYGGGFFSALWNGDLEEASIRADSNNEAILKSLNLYVVLV